MLNISYVPKPRSATNGHSHSSSGAASNHRNPTALGISMLLLLLSAIPFPEANTYRGVQNEGAYPFQNEGANAREYVQTPYLAYVASFSEDVDFNDVLSLGDEDQKAGGHNSKDFRDKHRRRNSNGKHRSSSSNSASSFSSDDEDLSEELLSSYSAGSHGTSPHTTSLKGNGNTIGRTTTSSSSSTSSNPMCGSLPTSMIGDVMQFLNLNEIESCRAVSSAFKSAADSLVSHRVSGYSFMKFNPMNYCSKAAKAAESGSSWTCDSCSAPNQHMSEACKSCKTANGVHRVFFGQLRKERTAELVHFMIDMIFPQMNVVHVESHTNPQDGRGKGCAWVYVSSTADAEKLLTMNKKLFVDFDDEAQHEGVWMVQNETLCDDLAGFAARKAYTDGRPVVLPRQCVVVELPKNSKLLKKKAAASAAPSPAATTTSSVSSSATRRRGGRKHNKNSERSSDASSDVASSNGASDAHSLSQHSAPTPRRSIGTVSPSPSEISAERAATTPLNYHGRRSSARRVTAEHYMPVESTYAPSPVAPQSQATPQQAPEYYSHQQCNCADCYNNGYSQHGNYYPHQYGYPQQQQQQHQYYGYNSQYSAPEAPQYNQHHGAHQQQCSCDACLQYAW